MLFNGSSEDSRRCLLACYYPLMKCEGETNNFFPDAGSLPKKGLSVCLISLISALPSPLPIDDIAFLSELARPVIQVPTAPEPMFRFCRPPIAGRQGKVVCFDLQNRYRKRELAR